MSSENNFDELNVIEKQITLFHAKIVEEMIKLNTEFDIDLVGFHGQTIFHNADEQLSIQLGDGKLLSQLIKKKVVFAVIFLIIINFLIYMSYFYTKYTKKL